MTGSRGYFAAGGDSLSFASSSARSFSSIWCRSLSRAGSPSLMAISLRYLVIFSLWMKRRMTTSNGRKSESRPPPGLPPDPDYVRYPARCKVKLWDIAVWLVVAQR
jgi:hypothetical protein